MRKDGVPVREYMEDGEGGGAMGGAKTRVGTAEAGTFAADVEGCEVNKVGRSKC